MIAVVKTTSPRTADGLPELAQGPVILGGRQILAVLEQVKIHSKAALVVAAR